MKLNKMNVLQWLPHILLASTQQSIKEYTTWTYVGCTHNINNQFRIKTKFNKSRNVLTTQHVLLGMFWMNWEQQEQQQRNESLNTSTLMGLLLYREIMTKEYRYLTITEGAENWCVHEPWDTARSWQKGLSKRRSKMRFVDSCPSPLVV